MVSFGYGTRRARKQHTCSNCGGEIRPGTDYRRWCCADGAAGAQTVRVHPRCAELWVELGYDWMNESDWGEFRQDCHAYGGPGPFPWEAGFAHA